MKDFFCLFVISFLLQVVGWYSLKKGVKNIENIKKSKELKVAINTLTWGLAIQLLLIIVWMYFYYIVGAPGT